MAGNKPKPRTKTVFAKPDKKRESATQTMPEDRKAAAARPAAYMSVLRTRAEEMLRASPGDLASLPAEDVRSLIHELQVHQMELEIQNDELRLAQLELAESHDRYLDLYELAPVGYLTIDSAGRVFEANLAAATMLEVDRNELIDSVLGKFAARESRDSLYLHQRAVFSSDSVQSCELEMLRGADGARFAAMLESTVIGTGENRQCRTALIDITERKAGEALRDLNENLQQEVFRASEEEKNRIARDLHDSLGSRLTGIGYRVSGLSEKLHAGLQAGPDEADTILEEIREAIVEVRALSQGLHPVRNEPEALATALKDLAERMQSYSQSTCRFIRDKAAAEICDPSIANHLYRIAQEAVTNALRHSGATRVTVHLKENRAGVVVTVSDNGCGMNLNNALRRSGLGLQTMEYRARAIGAVLNFSSIKGSGTRVSCTAPSGTAESSPKLNLPPS